MNSGAGGDSGFDWLPSIIVASHELKTPLALLRQYGLMLEGESLDAQGRQEVQQSIIRTSQSALELVSDLSTMANLNPTLFPLEPVSLSKLFYGLSKEAEPLAAASQRQIVWPGGRSSSQLVVANRLLLSRVLMNFLSNSLKYSEQSLPIKFSTKMISSSTVRLAVRDYGPAISGRDYRKLIDQLEVKKTLRTRPDSSGLGIYIASEFARAMDSRIGLTRHRDGLSFFVDTPISKQLSLL